MTLCLLECLRAIGLQRHYARFISMGVCRVAHLSALTMEDYPILGICTMDDRTRLFHLVQMVKTDLENLEDDDDDYGDEGYTLVDSSYTCNSSRHPDEHSSVTDNLKAAPSGKPSSICRRLDFSFETDEHQRTRSCPQGTVHVYASHNSNGRTVRDKKSHVIPVHLRLDNENVIIGSKGNKSYRIDAHSYPSDDQTRGKTKPIIRGGLSLFNSHTRLSQKYISFHKLKQAGHKDRKGISMKEKFCAEKDSNGASGHTIKATPVYESKTTAGYNYGVPQSSPTALNKRRTGDQRISVCVRKRPLTYAESRREEADVVTTPGGECVIIHEGKEAVDLTQYMLQHKFYFDQVCGENSTNEEVYHRTAYPLVLHMLNGGKATCFAYGQTGAGKTHTMLGSSPWTPGLYALAVRDIFAHLCIADSPLLVYVSFFEIYCGQLYDLLDHRKRLFAREDGQKVVHIAGLRDVRVDSVTSLLEVISQGTEERTQGMSGVNPLSSRSHALLQIQLRGPNQQAAGRMWFVDLAGSERASDTKEPDRQSRIEGAEINQSLLALKECIRSLDQEQSHTPFRQSKLTQVLKDSFVGDSMTCMIANISPGHLATEHTLNTLRYADRVKELRGQGGLRGAKKVKMLSSPKHNLSNSNNSRSGSRGKSPPKKAKLGRQREAFGTTTPSTRLPSGDAVLCSTPQNSRCVGETSFIERKVVRLEHISPIRSWVETGDKRERADERKSGGRQNKMYETTDCPSVSYKNAREGLVVGKTIDKQLHLRKEQQRDVVPKSNLSFSPREYTFFQREKESQQSILNGGKEDRKCKLQIQMESHRDTFSEVEKLNEEDIQKADKSDKERERHLRWYHQLLQQFMPLTSSSSSLFKSSSLSSSNQESASSCSSLQHSDLSVSALVHHGVEEVLDLYGTRVQIRADDNRGLLHFSSEKLESGSHTHGNSGGSGEECRPSWEGTEDRFGQDRDGRESRRPVKATGETRERRENKTPARIEGGEKKWVWLATSENSHTDRMTGAIPSNVEEQTPYNCDLEDRGQVDKKGQDTSDVPADEVWNTEEGGVADSCGSVPTHSNSLVNNPCSSRAPAERPLSPACEHTCHTAPVTPTGYKIPAEALYKLPDNPVYTQVCSPPEVKMSVSPQDEALADSPNYTMDPLSISLLQADQQVATESFLRGGQNNISVCLLKNKMNEAGQIEVKHTEMTGDLAEDEYAEFSLSPLEWPQAKTGQRKDHFCATNEHCGKGRKKHPEGKWVSLQDQDKILKPQTTPAIKVYASKAPTTPLNQSSCASMQTFVQQTNTPSVQHSDNICASSSHNLIPNGTTQIPPQYAYNNHSKPTLSISTQKSQSVSDHLNNVPRQCRTLLSNYFRDSNNSFQPNSCTENAASQQNRPLMHLSTLEDLDHAQWCVVQAHWEQLEEMEALCQKEGLLLWKQPDMAFWEYVHKLEKIMERKAQCVQSMRTQLQPYLMPSRSNEGHSQIEDHKNNN